jgi:hypothetical protein
MKKLVILLSLLPALSGNPAEAPLPILFRVSEGVRPNALLSLYG